MSTHVWQYGETKQKEFHERIAEMVKKNRSKKAMTIMSLCGRDGIKNRHSVELQLQRAFPGTRLILVDLDINVVNILIKDLKKHGYPHRFQQVWDSRDKKGKPVPGDGERHIFNTSYGIVEVWCATAKSYLRWSAAYDRKHDVMILDYYNHFMNYLPKDLKTIKDFDLIKENGIIFISSPRPGLDINTGMIKGILKQGAGDYSRGMTAILRSFFNARLAGSKKWFYKDDNSKIGMHVLALRFN